MYKPIEKEEFKYIDLGKGEPIIMLHGLFGALSNWEGVVNGFKDNYRVLIPILPLYTMPVKDANLEKLTEFVKSFIDFLNLDKVHLVGNSLGGHIGLIYTLKYEKKVKSLTLTGSSGLFESSMGASYPKRGDYEFVKRKSAYTFFDPNMASKELVDEVFDITQSIPNCLRIISIAKSAQRNNMAKDIVNIKVPTLLIWGLNDTITPPYTAHEFNRLIPGSKLNFIDECCHVPMMEHSDKFNKLLKDFILNLN